MWESLIKNDQKSELGDTKDLFMLSLHFTNFFLIASC
jgi:hypothetical protein